MAEIIKQNYVVMAQEEWSADPVPIIAAEWEGIANQFAIYWTESNHRTFGRISQAGVYDGRTGELITGYRNGEIIFKAKRLKKGLYPQ